MRYLGVELDHKFGFGPHTKLKAALVNARFAPYGATLGNEQHGGLSVRFTCHSSAMRIVCCLPNISKTLDHSWEGSSICSSSGDKQLQFQLHTDLGLLHWKPISRLCAEGQLLLMFKYLEGLRYLPDGVMGIAEPTTRQLRRSQVAIYGKYGSNSNHFIHSAFKCPE